jgi:Zn-dependent peptidase ImmA (M78 family)
MNTVAVSISVLRWAAGRAWLSDEKLTKRFRKWPLWISGEAQPTFRQLEAFARFTHTPIGYFFLSKPPELALPVPDFRTLRDETMMEPSSALLDTLFLCQHRQDWFRDHARIQGMPVHDFVGSVTVSEHPEKVALAIKQVLNLSMAERRQVSTWTDALRQLIARTEDAGVLVMVSSVVGSNSHRKLDVNEFRGFALADALAPLVFLNGADSKAAQMFTLAHELAHIWLGESGISDPSAGQLPEKQIERWCNRVAAELLLPLEELKNTHNRDASVPEEMQRLARLFKVSTLVVLRRLFDAGVIDETTLWRYFRVEVERIRSLERSSGGGGDFYKTLGARTGRRFARAVLSSTLEGQTLFQEAFRMLGMRKTSTFYDAAHELGVLL